MTAADQLLEQVRELLPNTKRVISCACCVRGIDDAEIIIHDCDPRPLVLCRSCARRVQRRWRELGIGAR